MSGSFKSKMCALPKNPQEYAFPSKEKGNSFGITESLMRSRQNIKISSNIATVGRSGPGLKLSMIHGTSFKNHLVPKSKGNCSIATKIYNFDTLTELGYSFKNKMLNTDSLSSNLSFDESLGLNIREKESCFDS